MRFSYVQGKRGQDESDSRTHAGRAGGAAVRGDRAARPGPRPGARKDRSCGRELHRRVPAHRALQGPAAGHAGTGSGGDCERRWPRRGHTQSWGARRVCGPARRVGRLRRGAGRPGVVFAERGKPEPGAAVMLQGMTAHYLATSTYALKPGDACLAHAAAGGVGLLLCQIAKLRGARVLGTVSTREKAALARGAGADEVTLYTEQDFETEVKRLTNGAGLQVIYDSVGKTTFEKGLSCLAPRGMMVLYGQSSGPVGPFDPQVLSQKGSLFLTRPTLAHYIATRPE